MFFALSWAMNTVAIHGLDYILRIDLGDVEERRLLPKKKEQSDSVEDILHEKGVTFALR
jgi:hypothetical protein